MLENIPNPGIIKYSNWNRVRECLATAQEAISKGEWDHIKTYDPSMKSYVYSLNEYGVILYDNGNTINNKVWVFWSGAWLENLLPWAPAVRDQFAKAGLPIQNITYHSHNDSIKPHSDTAYHGEFPDKPHTNINFIISSDFPDDSYTYVTDSNGNEMRYYSHPDKLWLLNASHRHAVVSSGWREGLIIKLRHSFDDINTFLKLNPNIFDENQPYFKF